MIDDLDLGVTFDIGHLLSAGGVVADHLAGFGDRLTVVHLHGFAGGKDHQAVTSYPPAELQAMLASIAAAPTRRPAWTGEDAPPAVVVDLEVFGWRPTVPSLEAVAVCSRACKGTVSRPPPLPSPPRPPAGRSPTRGEFESGKVHSEAPDRGGFSLCRMPVRAGPTPTFASALHLSHLRSLGLPRGTGCG